MARAILALKSCNLHGCARMARAILALKFGQWHYLRARMSRAILALPTIFECHNGLSHSCTAIYALFECQNGSSHSGTQVMQLAVPEWLEPFLHSSHATGRARMAQAILALKSCNLRGCARMARAILAPSDITCVQEWLEPFWHCQQYLSAIMARAILALKLCNWPCQNGSNHSYTQLAVSEWLEPFWHSSYATDRARMARTILTLR